MTRLWPIPIGTRRNQNGKVSWPDKGPTTPKDDAEMRNMPAKRKGVEKLGQPKFFPLPATRDTRDRQETSSGSPKGTRTNHLEVLRP